MGGDVAQLGERRLCKPKVSGSRPLISTKTLKYEEELVIGKNNYELIIEQLKN